MKRLLLTFLLFFLQAMPIRADLQSEIESDLKNERHSHLGKLLKSSVGKKITLGQLKTIAEKNEAKALLHAVTATQKAKAKAKRLGVSTGNFLEAAYYIEASMPKESSKESQYLPKKKTGLSEVLEHDPKTKKTFIVPTGKKATLGKGKSKKVTYALEYDHKRPEVVARLEQSEDMRREQKVTKLMHAKPGLFRTIAFTKHTEGKTNYKTIYSKVYSPGSLQTAFEKKCKLTMPEKMKVALDILSGLESLHSHKIVHRDLGARNYLIDIPKGKPGERKIEACIADLGRADFVKDCALHKIMGNTAYTSPEGLLRKQFKQKDYYGADIFAVGCVFYRLFYGHMGPWQNAKYVKDAWSPLRKRHNECVEHLTKATKKRRQALSSKYNRSNQEEFELLILRMLHLNPQKRGSAKSLKQKMEKIYS